MSLTLSQFSFYSVADSPRKSIHLIDDMPNLTPVVSFRCELGKLPGVDVTLVRKYEEYTFNYGTTNEYYKCFTLWYNSTANFTAYDPNEDKGRLIVHWSVRDTGFWKSWDNRNWNFVTKWIPR
ncbi:hypothetical protein RDI58_008879 [Solanum bulbocastanum]|uniref:Uncharacterized protein n=1 Tax=Solanum bulbocastanum TaxID=147425 RepID=A0AAN8U3E1_SOLBU